MADFAYPTGEFPIPEQSWAGLDKLKIGRFGEYFAKMAFVRAGFDVYSPEVDDRAIDLLLRVDGAPPSYREIQVKTVRIAGPSYVFIKKRLFPIEATRYLALVVLDQAQEPAIYLIPATIWANPIAPFSSRDYPGLKSEPEYGLSVSRAALANLEQFRFPAHADGQSSVGPLPVASVAGR